MKVDNLLRRRNTPACDRIHPYVKGERSATLLSDCDSSLEMKEHDDKPHALSDPNSKRPSKSGKFISGIVGRIRPQPVPSHAPVLLHSCHGETDIKAATPSSNLRDTYEMEMDSPTVLGAHPKQPRLSINAFSRREKSQKMIQTAVDRVALNKTVNDPTRVEMKEMVAILRKRLKEPWYLLDPQRSWRRHWDGICICALLYTSLVTPYEVVLLDSGWDDGITYFNIFVTMVYFADMVMMFCTPYFDANKIGGTWIRNIEKIRCHYLRTWFFIDFISIIPYEFLGGFATSSDISMSRLKSLRLLKIFRVLSAQRIYKRYENSISIRYSLLALINFSILLGITGHWIACGWIMVGNLQLRGRGERTVSTWLDLVPDICESDIDDIGSPMSCTWEDVTKNHHKVYAAALYWSFVTITSVGYGDITPTNHWEMLACTFFLLVSSLLWAYIISNATAIVSTGDPSTHQYHSTMDSLNEFMSVKTFPYPLRRRLRSYFQNRQFIAKSDSFQSLINKLSPALKVDVTELNTTWINRLAFFNGREPNYNLIVDIQQELCAFVFEATEPIPWENSLFGISRGLASRKGMIHTTNQNIFWGEDFVIESMMLKDKVAARALTFVEVLILSRPVFFDLLDEYPEEKALVRKTAIRIAFYRGVMAVAKRKQLADGKIVQGRITEEELDEDEPTEGGEQVPSPTSAALVSRNFLDGIGSDDCLLKTMHKPPRLTVKEIPAIQVKTNMKFEKKLNGIEADIKNLSKQVENLTSSLDDIVDRAFSRIAAHGLPGGGNKNNEERSPGYINV